MSDVTTIVIEKAVRDKLRELGKKGETYNEIVKRLLEKTINEK